ncbi:MAG: putative ATP-dependent transporter SufC [Candidatus Methanoperedenaceae archaeon GB37]|nr:putative ATP-dependent transporter SufC [Candidatus Methanoperedenaceae archaeon GB37]CAD7782309.1 MAG: putative ATP-dependent transporter SufC [Candidatus Methanoperedenaceae archaeon GB37]
MLYIQNLHVEVEGKEVIHGLNLEIRPSEVHCLLGPNGSGKTTLLMTIMGFSGYQVTKGNIFFKGTDITKLSVDERVKMGIGISFQRPPSIPGVKLLQLVELCKRFKKDVMSMAQELNLVDFLERDINVGFSGGEIKRSELLQLWAQNPDLVLLDEPESGVDVENIILIGRIINKILERNEIGIPLGETRAEIKKKRRKSGLVITHTGTILNYVHADKGHVLVEGRLACSGNPYEIFRYIREKGYEECVKCAWQARR